MGQINIIKLCTFHIILSGACRQWILATSREISVRKIFWNAENQTRGSWVKSANTTSVLCRPLHYQHFWSTGAKVFPGGARRGRQLDPGGHDLPGVLHRKRNRPHRGREVEAGGTFLHQVSSQALLYLMKAIQTKALLSLGLAIGIVVN